MRGEVVAVVGRGRWGGAGEAGCVERGGCHLAEEGARVVGAQLQHLPAASRTHIRGRESAQQQRRRRRRRRCEKRGGGEEAAAGECAVRAAGGG